MGFLIFTIVLCFNLYWLIYQGKERYFNLYNGKLNKWLSIIVWFYAAFGIANLIFGIYKFFII